MHKILIIIASFFASTTILLGGTIAIPYSLAPYNPNNIPILVYQLYAISFLFSFLLTNKVALILYLLLTAGFIVGGLSFSLKIFKNKKIKIFSAIFFIVAIIAYVFYLFINLRYSIPVVFTSETKYVVVTQPFGIDAIHKNILISTESRGDIYDILGWQGNDILIYTKDNGNGITNYSYNIKTHRSVLRNGGDLPYESTCEYKKCIFPYEKSGFYQRSPGYSGYLSPNGKSVAIIYKHIYGPQDIVIITKQLSF